MEKGTRWSPAIASQLANGMGAGSTGEASLIPMHSEPFQSAGIPAGKGLHHMDPHALLSTDQAARRFGVGKTTLLALVRSGRLPCKMLDGRIRVPRAAIEAFNDNLPAGYVAGKAVRHG